MADDEYVVTAGRGEEPTVVRSSRLDPALHGGRDAVDVIGVEADDGWNPTPFQRASLSEYLHDQSAVRAALGRELPAAPWPAFAVDTVVLPDDGVPLADRADRRALFERMGVADVDRRLDDQERLSAAGRRSAYDLLLHKAGDADGPVWIARFRDGELGGITVEG